MTDDRTREWLARLLLQAERGDFFGAVVIRYENGRPVHAEIQQSLKPPKNNC